MINKEARKGPQEGSMVYKSKIGVYSTQKQIEGTSLPVSEFNTNHYMNRHLKGSNYSENERPTINDENFDSNKKNKYYYNVRLLLKSILV